ncbi:MAG: proton-conducting transporter membrane subunit [Candidatus Thermoplasmatota archaeon]
MEPILPLLLLLVGAYLSYALGRIELAFKKKHWVAITSLVFFVLSAAAQAYLAREVWLHGTLSYTMGGTILRMDALAIFLALVALALGTTVNIYSIKYMEHDKGLEYYYPLLLLMVAGILGIGLATDLLVLFLFFELMAIPSYALVAFRRQDWRAVEAGMKYVVMSAAGSCIAFFGISLIYLQTGTLGFEEIALTDAPLSQAAMVMLIAGFGVKAAIAPLHTWLPDAHSAAPSGISAMLSGIVIGAGFFTLFRTLLLFAGSGMPVGETLIIMALITMTAGNLMAYVQLAYRQADLKRILAYSSVAQMGYIVLGVGVGLAYGIEQGFAGGLFHIMTHAFMKGLAFLCAGAIIHQLGTRYVGEMRGIGHTMKFTGFAFSLAALSLSGVPPLSGFMSEWMIFSAGIQTYGEIGAWGVAIAAIALINVLISLGYYLPIIKTFYLGVREKKVLKVRDPPAAMIFAMVLLAALTIVLGVWPELGLKVIKPAVDALMAIGG